MDNPINYWYQKYLALKAKMDKMMNGAIEGEVYKYDKFSYVKEKNSKSLTELLAKFNDGDTVKIIIVKEDKK